MAKHFNIENPPPWSYLVIDKIVKLEVSKSQDLAKLIVFYFVSLEAMVQ